LYVQNITTISKEVKQKTLSKTFNLITDQIGDFLAQSLGKGGVLRLQADPPARELEKFFTLGTEIPAYAGMTSLRAGVRRAGAPVKNSSQESEDFRLAIGFCIIVTTTWLKICRLVTARFPRLLFKVTNCDLKMANFS